MVTFRRAVMNATSVYDLAESAAWQYVLHKHFADGCVLEIDTGDGKKANAMNLEPGYEYTVIHKTLGKGTCKLLVEQLPPAGTGTANLRARVCSCECDSIPCPAGTHPVCNGGVLTCEQ